MVGFGDYFDGVAMVDIESLDKEGCIALTPQVDAGQLFRTYV